MKVVVVLDLSAGSASYRRKPTKVEIDKNIAAVERAIQGRSLVVDTNYLIDTKSILMAIKEQLSDI